MYWHFVLGCMSCRILRLFICWIRSPSCIWNPHFSVVFPHTSYHLYSYNTEFGAGIFPVYFTVGTESYSHCLCCLVAIVFFLQCFHTETRFSSLNIIEFPNYSSYWVSALEMKINKWNFQKTIHIVRDKIKPTQSMQCLNSCSRYYLNRILKRLCRFHSKWKNSK